MNLEKLFQTQKELGQVGLFNYRGPDRFNKLILALLVELGECANEWRGFKFWSVNQLPHTSAVRVPCMMEEDKEYYNPLLEEYVDGLHFILELGLEIDFEHDEWELKAEDYSADPTLQFIFISEKISDFRRTASEHYYVDMFELFIGLGKMLGFTWEQIEQGYFAKNAINHHRQEVGY